MCNRNKNLIKIFFKKLIKKFLLRLGVRRMQINDVFTLTHGLTRLLFLHSYSIRQVRDLKFLHGQNGYGYGLCIVFPENLLTV